MLLLLCATLFVSLSLIGTNGAGKTTTMHILTGWLSPTAGTAEVAGYDIVGQAAEAKQVIGYCPQFGNNNNYYCIFDGAKKENGDTAWF